MTASSSNPNGTILIEIPAEDLAAALESGRLTCRVRFVASKKPRSYRDTISDEERDVMEFWNSHPEREKLRGQFPEIHSKATLREIARDGAALRAYIGENGPGRAAKLLERYFSECASGRAVGEDRRCYAYSRLTRLFQRRQDFAKGRSREPWFLREAPPRSEPLADPSPELTRIIADEYARQVLGRPEYGQIANPSSAMRAFLAAAGAVRAAGRVTGLPPDQLARILVKCALDARGGSQAHPGDLSSAGTLNNLFPQAVERAFPGLQGRTEVRREGG